ncbi:Vps5 C terminal like-domain-containing protein [Zychaea mexicana]|uniref:Vps5 C terminal like-domain-containing protein n=1 Tax=Zychaea mexicana TaxID=64656 RepID=UPI0022FEE66B|nr:Vps5 C terminal like-domain-containing protein [Zychaea mexicana]KAI9498141.1 Vps5 C terminal like-domain-containing protein [Zychaea mexicana]
MPDSPLTLTVPEAAASIDIIQFKLVLGGTEEALNDYTNRHQLVQPSVVFRSFQQISWLHEKLTRAFPELVVPPLPDPPSSQRMDDQDYVERKRLQVVRFFERLITRTVFADHEDFVHFLSNDMTPTEVGQSNRGVLSFLRFNRVMRSNTDRGFKSYKATEPVEGNDQDTFHRHQIYILMLESYFGTIAESLGQLIQTREGLADVLAHMGDVVIETTQSKYRLGNGDSEAHRKAQRALDHKMQLFGLLMDELGFIFTRQGIEENMKFGDVMIEYKNSMDGLKTAFNARTQKLMDYVDSVKHRNKKRDKADKLKLRMGLTAPEVQATIAEEEEAAQELQTSRQEFDACQAKVKQEIQLFETQKQHDITRAIHDYVNLSLRYERSKLSSLEKAVHEIRQFNPKPVSLAHTLLPDEEESSTASSSTYDAKQQQHRKRRRRRGSRKHGPQAILSSASLPTSTPRKSKQKQSKSSDCESGDERDNDEALQSAAQLSSSSRVSPFIRYENQSRVHMSASYDERLGGAAGWLNSSD